MCLPYYYLFFFGSLRSPVLYKHYMYKYFKVKCSVWHSHPFLYFPYPTYKKNQLPLPCCYEKAFSYFSCLDLHDFTPSKPKIFCGRTPQTPLPDTFTISKLPCHPCVLCTEACNCTKDHSLPKINYCPKISLNINNCLESR